jgi:hypothetical protein
MLDMSRPFQTLSFVNGINLTDSTGSQPGTLLLTGAASRVLAVGNETINNATVYLGSIEQNYYGQKVAPAEFAASAGSTLTIGAMSAGWAIAASATGPTASSTTARSWPPLPPAS